MLRPRVASRIAPLLLVLAFPCVTRAECIPLWKSAADYLGDSTLIFVGTVTEIGDTELTTTFEVDRVWQGPVRHHLTVALTPGMEVWNWNEFKKGVTYLVFAELTPQKTSGGLPFYEVSTCSPTTELEHADKSIRQLNSRRKPLIPPH